MTSSLGERSRRAINLRASSKGHALETSAASRRDCDGIVILFSSGLPVGKKTVGDPYTKNPRQQVNRKGRVRQRGRA
jgi:hypothetical protein